MTALVESGCDLIEVGVPYSDPGMDGPTIARATEAALRGGVRVRDTLAAVEAISRAGGRAVVMTYWNPVLRYGVDAFARDLASAGGHGLITPDLIPDEAQQWLAASDEHGLDRIFLVAPSSTPQRLATTVEASRGFVYAASTMGVTGARDAVSNAAPELVGRVKAVSDIPVGVGLGVRSREQAAQIAGYADGVIVGSALVSALSDGLAAVARTDRGTRRRCAPRGVRVMTTWLAYFPSPPRGVWHLGPLPIRAYALFIIIGIVAALLIGDRRWEARGGERGVIYDIAMWAVPFGLIGGRLYHLATDWRTYWGPGGAGFRRGAADLGRRPGHLGRGGPRRRRRVDRLSAPRNPVAGLRRCARPGTHLGAGHRSARQLFQPGALRPGNHAAVGPGDLLPPGSVGLRRSTFARRRLDRAGGARRAADVPLRIDLERPGIRRL